MSRTSIASVLLVGASLAHGLSISSQCQGALFSIVQSPDAACLNPSGLVPLVTQAVNTSYVPAIDSWISGMCAQTACTNTQLSNLVTNITKNCGTDLAPLGINAADPSAAIADIQQLYPTVRKTLCLKDSTDNTLCATTTLNQIQSVIGTLSLTNIVSELPALAQGNSTLPANITCNDCVKEAYNILKQDQPAIASSTAVANTFEQKCGAAFINGATPTQIFVATGTAAANANSKSGGASSFLSGSAVIGVAGSSLAAVSAAFIMLA